MANLGTEDWEVVNLAQEGKVKGKQLRRCCVALRELRLQEEDLIFHQDIGIWLRPADSVLIREENPLAEEKLALKAPITNLPLKFPPHDFLISQPAFQRSTSGLAPLKRSL